MSPATPAGETAAAITNLHVSAFSPLIGPAQLHRDLPVSERAQRTVTQGREEVRAILHGRDERMLAIVGPCSIHDPEAARDYAVRLAALREDLADRLCIVMRVYFEKPRTTVGWKGLINDPHLDGSFDLAEGLRLARQLLLDTNDMGLPAGTEMLDPITPQYIADLVAWGSIGARTTESQTHRQMASGLSAPIGFKNATNGNLQVAIDAMKAARHPHHFLGIDDDGRSCVVSTTGNPDGHVILRGGDGRPNYAPQSVAEASAQLVQAGLEDVLVVDCSHANSGKKHARQETVWNSVVDQRLSGTKSLIGAMLESNLGEGRQDLPDDREQLKYGVSVTDECIGWPKTEQLLREAYDKLG